MFVSCKCSSAFNYLQTNQSLSEKGHSISVNEFLFLINLKDNMWVMIHVMRYGFEDKKRLDQDSRFQVSRKTWCSG